MADADDADRFTCLRVLGHGLHFRTHPAQNVEDARPGWIEADMFDGHVRAGQCRRRDNPERRRRDIARHVESAADQPLTPADRHRCSRPPDLRPERLERPLRVVAGAHRLDDACHPLGVKPGEEHRALYLRAGNLGLEVDPRQAIGPHHRERRPPIVGDKPCAHPLERNNDPPHGPTTQRSVARHGRSEWVRGENSREHADGASGVSGVEGRGRPMQPADLKTEDFEVNACLAVAADLLDWYAQRAQAAEGGSAVGARRITVNHRGTVGNRRQHRVPV
jgi:hypothetical protein